MRQVWMAVLVSWIGCTGGDEPTDPESVTTPPGPPGTTGSDPDGDGDGSPLSVDCDDADPAVHPAAIERCDGIDNDCELAIDDAAVATIDATNYATLADALADAGPGAVIDVCPGAWTLADTHTLEDGESLTVRGVAGRDATSVEKVGYNTAFRLRGSASLTIEGLTISGGSVALRVEETSTLTLTDSRLTENVGAMMIQGEGAGATVNVDRTEFVRNNAGSGFGGAVFGMGAFVLTMTDCVLGENNATLGGAIATFNHMEGPMAIVLERTTVSGNTAEWDGGGLFLEMTRLDLVDSAVVDNRAARSGGGLVAYGSTVVGDGASSFEGNTSDLEGGGGIRANRSSIADVLVRGNDAPRGGGVNVAFESALNPLPETTLTRVVVDGNTAELGGGIAVDAREHPTVDGCTVTTNAATSGGGAWIAAGATLAATSTDWGSADLGTDNTPDDVAIEAGAVFSWGAPVDILCDGSTGCL